MSWPLVALVVLGAVMLLVSGIRRAVWRYQDRRIWEYKHRKAWAEVRANKRR